MPKKFRRSLLLRNEESIKVKNSLFSSKSLAKMLDSQHIFEENNEKNNETFIKNEKNNETLVLNEKKNEKRKSLVRKKQRSLVLSKNN